MPTAVTGTRSVLSSLTLPNGQSYTFYYGNNNPTDSTILNSYGLLNEIIYPDGGWVKYTWQLSSGYNELSSIVGDFVYENGNGTPVPVWQSFGCNWQYQTPVLATRQVSFNGSSVAQTQNFTSSTTWEYASDGSLNGWSQKSTTVQTTDNVVGRTALTQYTYLPGYASNGPYGSGSIAPEIPLESTVTYYDWGKSTPMKTVTKTWRDQYNMTSESTTDNYTGQVKETVYSYSNSVCGGSENSSLVYLTEQDDWDYGILPSPQPATNPAPNVAPPSQQPSKRTVYNYSCFSPTPFPGNSFYFAYAVSGNPEFPGLTIPPKVSSVLIENGARTIQAATQYAYDGYTLPLQSVTSTQHDDSIYTSAFTARGNLTSVTRCTTPAASCTAGPTVTYNYDITGQPASMTDGCGNAACSDIFGANHTTYYSFTDSPAGGNSVGNSNAYLTSITYPAVGAVALQKKFQYSYQIGYLTISTDENGKQTTYQYSDPLDRPTQVIYPDGGDTLITYNDTVLSPSVTTKKLLNSSLSETSVATMDGMEHVVETQLTSDPVSADTVNTTYNGEGQAYTVSNPFRTTPNGWTSHYYDALGRQIETQEQDGSLLQWCYDGVASAPAVSVCSPQVGSSNPGTWVDSADEVGNHWQRTSDAFGRLTKVMEPNGASQSPSMETDYAYDLLNNLLSVQQWGGPVNSSGARARSFSYNPLSQLLWSTNPETGTIGYTYDANGNVSSKTDARSISTYYVYDNINRLFQKNYSSNAGDPSACMQYDIAASGGSDLYPLGRQNLEWTAPANTCPSTSNTVSSVPSTAYNSTTVLAHDEMGRVFKEQQCPYGGVCASNYQFSYLYDKVGGIAQFNNGMPAAGNSPTAPAITWGVTLNGADQLQALSVLSQPWGSPGSPDQAHPTALIQALPSTSTPAYDPMGHLVYAGLGINPYNNQAAIDVVREYDNRGRIVAEADGATAATMPTSATELLTVSGYDGGHLVCTTIWVPQGPYHIPAPIQICNWVADTGTLSVTINGFTSSTSYGQYSGDASVAWQLAAGFNVPGSPVSATVSGAQITLTALAAGTIGDYPVTISNGDITVSAQSPTLTGGQDLVAGAGSFYSYQVGSYAPNGNILSHKDSVTGTWNFSYDTLNRLTTAQDSAVPVPFSQYSGRFGCWNYDPFGNRTLEAYSGSASTPCANGNVQQTNTPQSGANNNRLSTLNYDAAGNVTYDSITGNSYLYDAEGRLCAAYNSIASMAGQNPVTQYVYDAGGARVAKGNLSYWPSSCSAPGSNGFALTNQYLLDLSGEQVTELDGAGNWKHSNAFDAGRLTAT
jgi:YD repeat-containing protein